MESPSPTDRRQAWVRTSRNWLTLEDTDPQEPRVPTNPSDTLPDDDVFLEGCSAGKIESWLQGCGPDQGSEHASYVTTEPLMKPISSFEDDLSLGAEATVFNIEENGTDTGTCPRLLPPPRVRRKTPDTSSLQQKLNVPFVNLGHSMASSGLSSDISKTASSMSEVLQLCTEDAEETLYQLGFGCDEPHVHTRIPARFFNFPSKLRGINFRLFLESQLRRLREEDPGLSLASRFRQVEVLTAMANAFYSLYSHVSRTPLQKLAPPELSFALSPAESKIGQRFFSSVRSEPRSPVERFKDTVSKMCLYTGPSLSRGSDGSSPHKCDSLPDAVGTVIRRVRSENQDTGDEAQGRAEDSTAGGDEEGRREVRGEGGVERSGFKETDSERAATSESERTRCLAMVCRRWSGSATLGPGSDPAESLTSHIGHGVSYAPFPKITQDVICPQIKESVRLAPFSCLHRPCSPGGGPRRDTSTDPSACWGGSGTEQAAPETSAETSDEESKTARDESDSIGFGLSDPVPVSLPLLTVESSPCHITVTGWEGGVAVNDTGMPIYAGTTPSRVTPTLDSQGNYLSPMRAPSLGQVHSPSDQQANSFELEEVHSAGEDDTGLTEGQTVMAAAPLSAIKRQRDIILRGDSLQSDSSGYAEEDCNPSSP